MPYRSAPGAQPVRDNRWRPKPARPTAILDYSLTGQMKRKGCCPSDPLLPLKFLLGFVHNTVNVGKASSAFRVLRSTLAGPFLFFGNDPFEDCRVSVITKNIIPNVTFSVIETVANCLFHLNLSLPADGS